MCYVLLLAITKKLVVAETPHDSELILRGAQSAKWYVTAQETTSGSLWTTLSSRLLQQTASKLARGVAQ